jgi:hypothetical protein
MNFEHRVIYYTLRGFLDNIFYPIEDLINEKKRPKAHMGYDIRIIRETITEMIKNKANDYEF